MVNDPYLANEARYDEMQYRRLGRSGLRLPGVSLGLWQNFGGANPLDTQRDIIRAAFDMGVTHFDLANNYGPPAGSAEEKCRCAPQASSTTSGTPRRWATSASAAMSATAPK